MYRGASARTAPPNEETPRECFERGMSRAIAAGDAVPEPANGGAATPTQGGLFSVAALRFVQQIKDDEAAQTMAEYAVVLAVISLIVVAALTVLGTSAASGITRVANFLNF